jgi:hypothetical protein
MAKPMTEEQRARWARWRAMGRTRFMLMGILLYGVPCSVLTLFWNYFLGGTLWHHLSVFIIFAALVRREHRLGSLAQPGTTFR